MPEMPSQRHAFVLRIWREESGLWRGWIQHAGSRDQAYVQNVEELIAFLLDHTAGHAEGEEANGAQTG